MAISLKQTRERMVELMNSNVRIQDLEWDDMHNIIDALDKQIPMKPNYGMAKLIRWRSCPACRTVVRNTNKFCDQCGQKLDWS